MINSENVFTYWQQFISMFFIAYKQLRSLSPTDANDKQMDICFGIVDDINCQKIKENEKLLETNRRLRNKVREILWSKSERREENWETWNVKVCGCIAWEICVYSMWQQFISQVQAIKCPVLGLHGIFAHYAYQRHAASKKEPLLRDCMLYFYFNDRLNSLFSTLIFL